MVQNNIYRSIGWSKRLKTVKTPKKCKTRGCKTKLNSYNYTEYCGACQRRIANG